MPPVAVKIIRTFCFAFLGTLLPVLISVATNLSDTTDWSFAKAAVVSGIFASFAAGLRTIAAFLPMFADDNVGIQKKTG